MVNEEAAFEVYSIGTIESPLKRPEDVPIQACFSKIKGRIIVFERYADGLSNLDGFSHITILYRFHLSKDEPLMVKPFLDDVPRGVFATRSPQRPNRIGLSTVKLVSRKGNVLDVEGLDVLDGTPLLDIKPYVPQFDDRAATSIGWLGSKLKGNTSKEERGV
ncbi:MAG: tRNA (N6-threonylcarbamoyladenosine(37)-N6)-methyltransferase TrmO [Methanobacteriota archaeon]